MYAVLVKHRPEKQPVDHHINIIPAFHYSFNVSVEYAVIKRIHTTDHININKLCVALR